MACSILAEKDRRQEGWGLLSPACLLYLHYALQEMKKSGTMCRRVYKGLRRRKTRELQRTAEAVELSPVRWSELWLKLAENTVPAELL